MSNEPKKKSQLYKNILTAGFSSVIARTVICPLERVEILRQIDSGEFKGKSLLKSLTSIYKNQGFLGLFKGNVPSLIRIFPFSAIEFYSMEFFKNIFFRTISEKDKDPMQINKEKFKALMICGTLTGLCAITFTYPFDVVRTRMAANITDTVKRTSFVTSFTDLYKLGGASAYYKGYYITFIGSVPYVAIKQSTYEGLKQLYKPKKYHNVVNFCYGSFAGLLGTTLLYPTYMLKRVLQANSKYFNLK